MRSAYSEVPLHATHEDMGSLGRYALRHELGGGASGTVWSAFDPETDREVAVTLMRTRLGHADDRSAVLQRAEAWAALHHPAVAQIHEVGLFVDTRQRDRPRIGVYVVRARVAGVDLQRWLDALPANLEPPATATIIDLFCEAGRGLAAAHRVGLVHRDFCPASVIVDYAGHAHLVDFAATGALPMHPSPSDENPRSPAPELRRGAVADARSDQFSFCASLRDALTRQPGVRLSRRLREVIERGMADRPEDRWPTMDALLDAVQRSRGGWLRVLTAALRA
jgi:serine/threonine protein kinase